MVTVETTRLVLRRIQDTDYDAYYRCIYADPEVMKTLASGEAISRQDFNERIPGLMIDHWVQHGFGPWVIIHKADQVLIGHCGLKYWPDAPDVEVLYALNRRYWGQGLATEAARASLRYGFETLQLDRIIAGVLPTNQASRRVLEKIGMQVEGEMMFRQLPVVGYAIARSQYTLDRSHGYQLSTG